MRNALFGGLNFGINVAEPDAWLGWCAAVHLYPPFHPAAPAFAEQALAPRNRAAASPYPLSRNNCWADSAPPGGPDRAFILGIHRLNIKDNRNAHRLFPVI